MRHTRHGVEPSGPSYDLAVKSESEDPVVTMPAKVLIVEDEMIVAMEMEAVVEDLGHEPIGIAPDANTAVRLAQKRPDIALVDLHLRDGLTGSEIGQQLAESGIAVIFATANLRIVADGVDGAIGVVEKSIDETSLASIIDYAICVRSGAAMGPPAALMLFDR